MLLSNGKHTLEVVDPEALQMIGKDGWREASEEETTEYYNDPASSHAEKVERAKEAGLDPEKVQPSQPFHTTPQVGDLDQAERVTGATGVAFAPQDGERADRGDEAVTSEHPEADEPDTDLIDRQVKAQDNASTSDKPAKRTKSSK